MDERTRFKKMITKKKWVVTANRMDFKLKMVKRDKGGGYSIMIKGSVHQEGTTGINIYAPNIGVPKYIK